MRIVVVTCLLVLVLATLASSQPRPRRVRIIIIRVRPVRRGRRDVADLSEQNIENSQDNKYIKYDLNGSDLKVGDIIEADLVDEDGNSDGDIVYGKVIEDGVQIEGEQID